MTSTGTNIGFGEGNRNSSKVLKPPGGGTSDIFGANGASEPIRKVKNHQHSNLFLNDEVDRTSTSAPTPIKTPGNKDSHQRLFGPPSPPKATPQRNKPKSNVAVVLNFDQQNGNNENCNTENNTNGTNGTNGTASSVSSGGSENGENGISQESSPIKEELQNGNKTAYVNGNGNANPAGSSSRVRVPPGGYSSGLW